VRRGADTIAETVDGLGASLAVTTSWDHTTLSAAALAVDTDVLLSLVAEIAREPAFPPEELAALRTRRLSQLTVRRDSPSAVATETFAAALYPGHPYGSPPDGTPGSVEAIGREDCAGFHARHFTPDNAVLVVVGAVDPPAVLRRAE